MEFTERFKQLVTEKHLFDKHEKVLVALSGGIDSQTLFNVLYALQEDLQIEVGVAHVNHKQRLESDQEEVILKDMMDKLDVPFFITRFTEDKDKFTEASARDFRYSFFEEIMEKEGYTALVTAHHKGDQVETVLMREIRGSRLRHLTGISERQDFANGELIRPFLTFKKEEFETTDYLEDSTNFENNYLRNRIRNIYIPEMEKENPKFQEAIVSISEEVSLAMDLIKNQISELDIIKEKIDLANFLECHYSLQYFILQEYLEQFPDFNVSKALFDELLHLIRRPEQFMNTVSKDYIFIKDSSHFYLCQEALQDSFTDRHVVSKVKPLVGEYEEIYIPEGASFNIRKREAGDKILVNSVNKKLRRYFIDEKIPLIERDQENILEVDGQIYAILGIVLSDLSKSLKNGKIKDTLYYYER